MQKPTNTFGIFIQRCRIDLHLKQNQVASRIGVGTSLYSMWESGKRKPRPNSLALTKLSILLNVSKVELFQKLGYADIQPNKENENILSLLQVIVGSKCTSITLEEIGFLIGLSSQFKISEDLLPALLQNRILPNDNKSPIEK